ncbi:hypothetical protein [Chitinophaga sancti]|uniref:Uncharacterized protein n=1 Tax=Chitinophaga sancti TaxID=1004 RepID=A0A1K1T4V2_9BACT|nr:hypothetical protein [Chitinophaga sancti]WQD63624.1 hypothetical protein U0033_04395 [Chitinophaga sancti]WQG90751.1 hypothetical protein SR876_04525 [Chitinophaga sancti]SFW91085.1 hypothetical protein SAMN05661012_06726 [Chitinophaga sancti]
MTTKNKIFPLNPPKKTSKKPNKRTINPEFTTAIRAAKLIRVCAAFMAPDRQRFYRLSKFILHQVIHADTCHPIGERQILHEHLKVFENYAFDPDHPLEKYLPADIITSVDNKISISIPQPAINWPAQSLYYKIFLLGVSIDFQAFTASSVSQSTEWLTQDTAPIHLEIDNTCSLLIAIGIAFSNNKTTVATCKAVKIICVNT